MESVTVYVSLALQFDYLSEAAMASVTNDEIMTQLKKMSTKHDHDVEELKSMIKQKDSKVELSEGKHNSTTNIAEIHIFISTPRVLFHAKLLVSSISWWIQVSLSWSPN